MAGPDDLEEFLASDEGQELQVELAGLSDAEHANVANALRDAAEAGELGDINTDDMILDAQAAETAREDAEYYQAEQAKAAEAGDWETAKDFAEKAEDSMMEVREHGGDVAEAEIMDAQKDEANLDWADYHQEISDDAAATAEAYAESGDTAAAEVYADTAADHGTTAADYGASADQGGTYADQSVDTSSSYDASATVATVDTSSSVSTVDTTTTE